MKRLIIISLLFQAFLVLIIIGFGFYYREVLVAAVANQVTSSTEQQSGTETFTHNSKEDRVVSVIEDTNEAVVSIVVTKDVPIYERYYEEYNPFGGFFGGGFSVPRVRENGTEEREVGGGSGFVVSIDGLIVTNRHVVDDQEANYSVITNQGETWEVEVVGRDQVLDIAVLKIIDPPESLTYLEFGDSETLKQGETVIAIGNALAEFRNSVSVGVVSGLSRSIVASSGWGDVEELEEVIQTDAAINPGNSGGPLLNLEGKVIGVNVAASRGAENIGFALPANVVANVVDSVKEYGEIVRPFLGVRYAMISESLAESNSLPVSYGALIIRGEDRLDLAVIPGSPADKANLVENDIILEVGGVKLEGTTLAKALRQYAVGDTVTLLIYHKGEEKTVSITLEKAPN